MLHHNKKRNVGLLNEFFARFIAENILHNQDNSANKAKNIYKKYFSGNSNIAKENFLFNTLYGSKFKNKETAVSLIEKIKDENKNINHVLLESEKTKLINEINVSLGTKFFEYNVGDFRNQATIQILLNSWRETVIKENASSIFTLEDNLIEYLCSPIKESIENKQYLEMTNEDVDSLVVNIMLEKFNEKYAEVLTKEQCMIISGYILSNVPYIKESLISSLENVRTRTFSLIEYTLNKKNTHGQEINETLNKKLVGVKNLLTNQYKDTSNIDENTISFYMKLTEMQKELSNG